MTAIKEWFKTADEYCFGYGSATTLGLIRIIGGFLLFVNLLMVGTLWEEWYSERGYVPSWVGAIWFPNWTPLPTWIANLSPKGLPRIDLLYGVTDPRISIPFFAITTLAALFTSLGIYTRVSGFILCIGYVSISHRNGAILHGGDTVMRMMAIYLAVIPCGRACSVDRLYGLWKGRLSHEAATVSVWGQRLISFNVALIYFTTVWLKWDGSLWRNFTASYYPQQLAEFYRFPMPEFMKSMWMARITTAGTIMVEFSMGTIVFFPPARRYVLAAGIAMHSYIEYSMNIPLFSFIMITTYLSFFQGEEIQGWAQRMGMRMRKLHVILRLPQGMQLTPRGAYFLQALDPFSLIAYLPGDTETFTATTLDTRALSAQRAIKTRCVGGWIFLWAPGVLNKILSQSIEPIPEPVVQEVPMATDKEHAGATTRRKRR